VNLNLIIFTSWCGLKISDNRISHFTYNHIHNSQFWVWNAIRSPMLQSHRQPRCQIYLLSQLTSIIPYWSSVNLSEWFLPPKHCTWLLSWQHWTVHWGLHCCRLQPTITSKVIDFGTNWKRVHIFLLVVNSNLDPILHRFRDMAA